MNERRADAPLEVHRVEVGTNAVEKPGIDRAQGVVGKTAGANDPSRIEISPYRHDAMDERR